MTTTPDTPHVTTLARAIEARDAETITSLYAKDATVTILDRDHPPSSPQVLTGREQIGAYYRDVCGRNIEHQVRVALGADGGLAYTQHCRYPDGAQVICTTVATVRDGLIVEQTGVQAWD